MPVRIVGAERPLLTAALSVALTVTGCATGHSGGSGWNLTGKAKRPTAESSAEVMSDDAAAEPGANPFRDPEQIETASVSATREKTVASPADAADMPRFDAATMMLIETEFKDASAEERKRWFAELKEVPPEMIPRILKMRRLTQQALQEQQNSAPSPAADRVTVASNEVAQPAQAAGHEATTSRAASRMADYPASENRLKAVAPWDSSSDVQSPESPSQGGLRRTTALISLRPRRIRMADQPPAQLPTASRPTVQERCLLPARN